MEKTSVEALLRPAESLTPAAVHLRDKMRWNIRGGLDEIPPDMVKRAPILFFTALAFIAIVGSHARKQVLREPGFRSTAMAHLLLGSEPEAADNLERAKIVGAYVADLWLSRGKRSGKYQDAYFP